MAWSIQQILEQEWQDLANEEAHAAAALEQARIVEDIDGVQAAKERIYAVDMRRNSLTARVNRTQQQPQQMPGVDGLSRADAQLARHYHLTPEQLSIAKNWTSDQRLSDDEKVRSWIDGYQQQRDGGPNAKGAAFQGKR
jgi:hypothetical protein